jgi:hypothetical protein
MHLHKFRTIRPDIQGGDEPGCTVLLLEDVDMGQRGVICFETLELLADGLKCGRVRPSFLAAASAFDSIFLRMRPRVALVFLFAEQTFIALVFKFDAISPSVSSQRARCPEASQLVRASEYLRAVIVVSLVYRLCCSFGFVVRRLSSKTVSRRRDYRQSLFLSSSPLDPGLCEPGLTSMDCGLIFLLLALTL